ncbi:MAG: S9 family peptidase [Gemmatimonadetes bacterium]|nr:S9 family peptidase [Gemmatimonadota bacterium]
MCGTSFPASRGAAGAALLLATALLLGPGAAAAQLPSAAEPLGPPVAERWPKVDTVHGDVRQDDYFWLRQKSNPAVRAYLEAENAYAEQVLSPTRPLQEALYQELLGRIKQTDLSVPYRQGEYFYYSKTEQGKQYQIHARKKGSLDAPEEVTLDLNVLAEGKPFLGLGAYRVSDDGNLLAFSTDTTGFREYTLQVKDLRTGELLVERIPQVRSVVWSADGRFLFYTAEDHAKRPYRLYRHVVGRSHHADELVYEEKDELYRLFASRTRSKGYILLTSASLTTSEVRYLAAGEPLGEWRMIAPRRQGREYDVDHHGRRFYIRVNDTGRNFRLVSAPVEDPGPANWGEVVPQRKDVMLEGMDFFAGHYVLYERRNGVPEMRVTELRSGKRHRVRFPEPVYEAGPAVNAEWNTNELRYNYESLVTPSSVFEYDMDRRRATLLKQTEVLGGYDPHQYASERRLARARDGTRIPVSLLYRKGVRRDGRAPLLLAGYGSYGAPYRVGFSSNRLSLLDRGVVVAMAHVRGGGELGKGWHDDGRMMRKMNTFTDFIAAAEFLIAEKYTSSDRVVIEGGSAGGLLMGAVTNLRPDLFRAVIARVPFVDVINTMLDASLPLTVQEYEEWGNPHRPDEYAYIKQYCPYTNLAAKAYPAMLVKTSFNDSQVMYWEPAKYVARMRVLKTDANPLLLVTNMGGGHGGASGRYDRLREIALDYAFVLQQMGLVEAPAPALKATP